MIIRDINKIDRLAEDILGQANGYVSVDMIDYSFIKESSSSLSAIKIEIPVLTETTLLGLVKELKEVTDCKINNMLIYFSAKTNFDKGQPTMDEQLNLFHNTIKEIVPANVDIIWGIGESVSHYDSNTILIVVGYSKDEK